MNVTMNECTSVADPDPGLGAFLTPGSGIRDGRKSASGSGIRDEQSGSYFLELRNHFFAFLGVKILKFFDEDPGSGMETVRIQDGKKSNPGSGINIPDPQHWNVPGFRIRIDLMQSGYRFGSQHFF
jgi:hypothetical protein